MCQFSNTDRGMMIDAMSEELVDRLGCASLQHIEINAGIEKKGPNNGRPIECPTQLRVRPALEHRHSPLRLECPYRALKVKAQDRYLPGCFPCGGQGGCKKSSSIASFDSASSSNLVLEVTRARFLAASVRCADTLPDRRRPWRHQAIRPTGPGRAPAHSWHEQCCPHSQLPCANGHPSHCPC